MIKVRPTHAEAVADAITDSWTLVIFANNAGAVALPGYGTRGEAMDAGREAARASGISFFVAVPGPSKQLRR